MDLVPDSRLFWRVKFVSASLVLNIRYHYKWVCVEQAVGEDLVCEEVGLSVENMSTVPGHHYNLTTLKLSSQVGCKLCSLFLPASCRNLAYEQILWGTTVIFPVSIHCPYSTICKNSLLGGGSVWGMFFHGGSRPKQRCSCKICYHLLVFVCV